MAEEEFKNHVEALAVKRLEKPKKLASECMKHWGEIVSRQYNYDRGQMTKFLSCWGKLSFVLFFSDNER